MQPLKGVVENNQILIASRVSVPANQGFLGQDQSGYTALIDTGAQRTLISPNVISEIGLIPSGWGFITPVNGEDVFCFKYKIRLDIPMPAEPDVEFWGKVMDVFALPYQPENYDVLFGMDFLSGFRATLYKSHFTLSIPKES